MRIASLQPSITVTLARLGRLDLLCACTKYCLDAVPGLADRGIPVLHDSWTANSAEILETQPDLVIASVPYRMESLAAILKSGLPVLTLAPHTLSDIAADTRLIASIINQPAAAEALIAQMEQTITRTGVLAHTSTVTPSVYCEEWGKPLIHSQEWVSELVSAAGGHFIGTAGAHTTPDAVAAADPDVLLFAWCGAGDRVPLARIVEQRGWQHLRAVKNRKVFCIPDELLNTPAITLLDGLACIAAALHPELFPSQQRLIQL